jgi:hypothetical protein
LKLKERKQEKKNEKERNAQKKTIEAESSRRRGEARTARGADGGA